MTVSDDTTVPKLDIDIVRSYTTGQMRALGVLKDMTEKGQGATVASVKAECDAISERSPRVIDSKGTRPSFPIMSAGSIQEAFSRFVNDGLAYKAKNGGGKYQSMVYWIGSVTNKRNATIKQEQYDKAHRPDPKVSMKQSELDARISAEAESMLEARFNEMLTKAVESGAIPTLSKV